MHNGSLKQGTGGCNPQKLQATDLAKECCLSSWLTVLPILEHSFHLHKGDFRDALSLGYDITPSNTSNPCQCGMSFSVYHAMVCPIWGSPMIRYNKVRDLNSSLLSEVCHFVATEPSLQLITSETFTLASANTTNDAHLDIKARGFGSRGQDVYFDLRIFYPNASSYHSLSLTSAYKPMRIQRSKNMVIDLGTLSIESSLHWSLL